MANLNTTLNITKNLDDLLKDWVSESIDYKHVKVEGLTLNSKQVKPNYAFFATIGFSVDGRNYIDDAIQNGASVVVCEDYVENEKNHVDHEENHLKDEENQINAENIKNTKNTKNTRKFSPILNCDVPIFYIKNLPEIIGLIAEKFYDYPSKNLTVIGITGTNGKTSCCHFIASLCQKFGVSCGIIGTVGAGFLGELVSLDNTTPDAITVQYHLAKLRHQGATVVAMEASSQALVQQRLCGVRFSVAGFTNLTRDHIGNEPHSHKNMEEYGKAKQLLFANADLKYVVLNNDDDFSQNIATNLDEKINVYGYGVKILYKKFRMQHFMYSNNVKIYHDGFEAEIIDDNVNDSVDDNIDNYTYNQGMLRSNLLGTFNLSNLLLAISVMRCLGFSLQDILCKISLLHSVDGRMQIFRGSSQLTPLVVVDYAHTPDALEKALQALREHCKGKIWCVFGCGGDKDRGKRPLMGKIAENHSDFVVITNDNPRTENPKNIVQDIMQGIVSTQKIYVECDRPLAIAYAIKHAQKDDVILIAGKGHEDYQIIGVTKYPCHDASIVQECLL